MWQFAKTGSRLRSPASIELSFHCEGVLLSAPFESEIAPARAAGTEDSRKAKATWQSASTDVLKQSKCRQLSVERLPFGTHSPFQARHHLLQTMISSQNLLGAGSSSFEAEYASGLKYGITVQRAGNRVQTRLCQGKRTMALIDEFNAAIQSLDRILEKMGEAGPADKERLEAYVKSMQVKVQQILKAILRVH